MRFYTAINKPRRASDVYEFCWRAVEFELREKARRKPGNALEDVAGRGQIIWCFISEGESRQMRNRATRTESTRPPGDSL